MTNWQLAMEVLIMKLTPERWCSSLFFPDQKRVYIACSILPEGALFHKVYLAEGSDINVQPS